MDARSVLEALGALERAGVRAWVGGGWGVDALVGRQTRAHRDLDLAIDAAREGTALEVLGALGYAVETDWRPARVELRARGGRFVDLHPVVFDARGDGRQAGRDGAGFRYPAGSFTTGVIGGEQVPCLDARLQLSFHAGYEHRDADRHDVALLRALPGRGRHRPRDEEDEDASVVPTAETGRPFAGRVSSVELVDGTVRRATGPWTPAVHALLRHLERAGFPGAPRVLGVDDRGREVLTLVEGLVPATDGLAGLPDAALEQVGALVRELHEATAGFALPPGVTWATRHDGDGPATVVGHGDLAPRNTVFRGGRPVAFIDWDLAGPAPAAWDLAHAAWQFVPLVDDAGCRSRGWPQPPDRPARLARLAGAYGAPADVRRSLVALVQRRMLSSARGIEELADAGVAAHRALVQEGVPAAIRREAAWTARNAARLTDALAGG